MEILEHVAVFFHLIGFASLFGVAAVQVRATERIARNGMFHGALTQLISGIILAWIKLDEIDHVAAAVKLGLVVVIVAILAYYRRAEGRRIPARAFFTVFALTFVEVLVAVLWLETETEG